MDSRYEAARSPRHARTPPHGFLRATLLGFALFSPFIVGVSTRFGHRLSTGVTGATLVLLGVLWMLSGSRSERSHKIVFAIVSCFLTVTLLDLIARPLVGAARFPVSTVAWPPMPLVRRYLPNVRFSGTVFGESAQVPGLKRYREYHEMRFITDRFGFRNAGPVNEQIDVIALGDSYTTAHNTTQEATWSTILSKQYGLHVYNLAVADDGPWHELTNLMLEVDRLSIKPRGTVVLWNLFTANDMSVACYPIFRKDELPWRNGLGRLASEFSAFRSQSPLGRALARTLKRTGLAPQDTGIVVKNFVDGTGIIFYTGFAREADRSLDDVRRDPNYNCVRQTISAMRRFADAKNLTVAIMVSPPGEEVYSWVLHGAHPWSTTADPSGFALAIREIARENHIPFLDLKPPLIEASRRVYQQSGHLLWARDDPHWNVDGNLEVAKIAYGFYSTLQSRITGDVLVPRQVGGSSLIQQDRSGRWAKRHARNPHATVH